VRTPESDVLIPESRVSAEGEVMLMSGESLQGMTALVTGAAKRIGREIALGLARAGVNVAVHFRQSGKQAEILRMELTSHGVSAWLVEADLSDAAATRRLIPEVLEQPDHSKFW